VWNPRHSPTRRIQTRYRTSFRSGVRRNPTSSVRASHLYSAYVAWAGKRGLTKDERLTNAAFGRRMARQYEKVRDSSGVVYKDVSVNYGAV